MRSAFRQGVIGLAVGLGLAAAHPIGAHAAQPPPAGQGGAMVFTEPSPIDFDDHEGYVSLFDGVSLKGWDGNPKFWRVEDGAIVGESTPTNPSGNSYIVYRGPGGEGLHAEVRDQDRGRWRQRHPVPQHDRVCPGSRTSRRTSPPTSAPST